MSEHSKSAIDYIIADRDLLDAIGKADDQSVDLLAQVFDTLRDRLAIDNGTAEALSRLLGLKAQGKDWDSGTIRNNVFKAAHALGLDLPSYAF